MALRLLATRTAALAGVRHLSRSFPVAAAAQKKLFTPGPLNTSETVKAAMMRDLGSRDVEFVATVKRIRDSLLRVAGVPAGDFTSIPIQGAGTFAVEAVITTFVPRGGKMLVISNGAYGNRIADIARVAGIDHKILKYPETSLPDLKEIESVLKADPSFTNVACVHCETSCGIVNPAAEIGRIVRKTRPNAMYFVDAMSSLGGVPLDFVGGHIDFAVSSANKCVEGVPGFSYVIANKAKLAACDGQARSLSFDLVAQARGLDKDGQFRFTPATHAMLAFDQALKELEAEGGTAKRAERYQKNKAILRKAMSEMGFTELLDPALSGYIITSYKWPKHPNFSFNEFYERLNARDLVIYPGKVTEANCFRIGSIGQLFPKDMERLVKAIREVCAEMKMDLPLERV